METGKRPVNYRQTLMPCNILAPYDSSFRFNFHSPFPTDTTDLSSTALLHLPVGKVLINSRMDIEIFCQLEAPAQGT